MSRPCDLDAIEARRLIGNKKLSPLELTKSCIEQIEKLNPSINAVVAINNADVLKQAKKAEDDVMSGSELGLLHGLPVGIKDLNIVKNHLNIVKLNSKINFICLIWIEINLLYKLKKSAFKFTNFKKR